MFTPSRTARLLTAVVTTVLVEGCATPPAPGGVESSPTRDGPLPLTMAPRPTRSAVTERDLMTRLYIFADDSMLGRQGGTIGNLKGTAYIEGEVRRLGLEPGGDSGTFFQDVPLVRRSYDPAAALRVGDSPLKLGVDYLPIFPRGAPRPLEGATVVYGGIWGDTSVTEAQAAGKVLLFAAPSTAFLALPRMSQSSRYAGASAVMLASLDAAPPPLVQASRVTSLSLSMRGNTTLPQVAMPVYVTRRAAALLLGRSLDGATPGTPGGVLHGAVGVMETGAPARNVVAILRGSDPALRQEYVALGAHNDHLGGAAAAVDHDSLHAFNAEVWRQRGRYSGLPELPAEQRSRIVVNVDSLRAVRAPRRDSVYNGADDDGSGSMALLELAESLKGEPRAPRRSILFVWHTGEELGLLGSRWYTDHPTVPRESIVTQINIDMIGRGSADDTRGGGPAYLGIVGSRRLSTELGDLTERVNAAQPTPLVFDYALDANGHPENIYCRSDHYNYARYGIPIVFLFTGLHGDYHQVTDEPQYLDYFHMARITNFVRALTVEVANLDHRVAVDKLVMGPGAACRQ